MNQRKDPTVEAAIETQERIKACKAEIDKVLIHFGCLLDPQVIINSRGVFPLINIVPRPKLEPPPPAQN